MLVENTVSLEKMIQEIDQILVPYDITITKKMTSDDILQLYFDLKDMETVFSALTECAYIVNEVKNLKN